MSRRGVNWRANKEQWQFKEIPHPGGAKRMFIVRRLPADVQRRVRVHFGELPEEMAELVPVDFPAERVGACARDFDCARGWQRSLAIRRVEVLQHLEAFRNTYEGLRSEAVRLFTAMFNSREVEGMDPGVYGVIPRLSRTKLYDWEQRFQDRGIAGLISGHGHWRGKAKLPLDQQQFIMATLSANPHLKAIKVARSVAARFGKAAASPRQVREFIRKQKEADPYLHEFLVNPDRARGKYQLALGSADEKAHRFLHFIEVDSTAADVMCVEGQTRGSVPTAATNDRKTFRPTIIGGIDVFSRKARFVVTRTSNSWGIAGLIRRIAMEWGLPETVIRDNGQDYASKMVNEGLLALGVGVVAVPPFTPEAKPHVERVFRTLSHDLFEGLPGYIGHDVAERKGIESRRSFAERMGRKKTGTRRGAPLCASFQGQTRGCAPTTAGNDGMLTMAELQAVIDRWTEEVYHQRRHAGINTTPNAKAASVPFRPSKLDDPRALDILLAPCGERTMGKKGLRYDGGFYWADELIDWIGRTLTVRVDVRNAGMAFCFDPQTRQFVCEAEDMALSGISVADKIRARKRQKKHMRERGKAMERLAETNYTDPLADEIARIRSQGATVTNLAVGDPVEGNPFIDGAMAAVEARDEAETAMSALPPRNDEQWIPDHVGDAAGGDPVGCPYGKTEDGPGGFDDGDGKVVPFRRREEAEELDWNPIKKFESLRGAQRMRPLTAVEEDWLGLFRSSWETYALMFVEQWDRRDHEWLARIAPDLVENIGTGGL